MRSRRVVVVSVICLMLIGACGTDERVQPPDDPEATALVIAQGTQGRVGDLSIGVSSVARAPATSPTAGQFSTIEAVRWDVCPAAFGTVTTSGLFQASTAGVGYVIARGRRAGTFGDVFPGGIAIVAAQ